MIRTVVFVHSHSFVKRHEADFRLGVVRADNGLVSSLHRRCSSEGHDHTEGRNEAITFVQAVSLQDGDVCSNNDCCGLGTNCSESIGEEGCEWLRLVPQAPFAKAFVRPR